MTATTVTSYTSTTSESPLPSSSSLQAPNETVVMPLPHEQKDTALIVLSAETKESMKDATNFIRQGGGELLHAFPTHILIVRIPRSLRDVLVGNAGIERVEYSTVDPSTVAKYGDMAMIGVEAWNNNFMGMAASKGLEPPVGFTSPGPIMNDTLIAPRPAEHVQAAGAPYGAGFYDTSEYMIGNIAVAIILPESNGAIDPNQENWTSGDISSVVSEIQAAMNWWAAREPKAHLSFTYFLSVTPTSYEPISHKQTDEGLWIGEVMQNIGYPTGDYKYRVRSYLNNVRNTYGTDWAVAIFVAHSYWDIDGRFADGKFAYSYLGGPFTVMTYDNDGYFLWNMDAVTAHEFGHLFYALDQYTSAGYPCTARSGYLNIENQNSAYPSAGACLSNVDSIMRGDIPPYTAGAVDQYARQQVGWRDSNGNGVMDIIDFYPQNVLNSYTPDPTTNPTPSYSGYASSQATYPNNNPYSITRDSITINTITSVYFWVEDTNGNTIRPSQLASPTDGGFDSAFENYAFTVTPALSPGTYKIASIAWNSQSLGLVTWDWLTVNSKPWANIVSPSGWLRGTVTLTATAGDPDGYVVRVRFLWTPDIANGPFYIIGDDTNGADGWSILWNCGGPSNNDPSVWVAAVALDNSGFESDWSWSNQFGVDQTPPTTPSLSSPNSGSGTTNPTPTFTWNAASDSLSGVASYTFQLDTSTSFNSGNLRTVTGISSTSYTPSAPLSYGTWYWRVKGVDNAGNEGSFSSYWSIAVLTMTLSPTSAPLGYGTLDGTISVAGEFATGTVRSCQLTSTPTGLFATSPAPTCSISSSGAVTGSFAVAPTATPSSYVVRVTDTNPAGVFAETGFTVLSAPTLNPPTPASGPTGTMVTLNSASAFAVQDVGACTITATPPPPVGGNMISSPTCSIDSAGNLASTSFTVYSYAPGGVYTVWVTGLHGDYASTSFTVTPQIALSPTSGSPPVGGSPGTEVTVSGSGFKPSGVCMISAQAGLIVDTSGEPACSVGGNGLLSASAKFKVGAGSTYSVGGSTYTVTVTGPGGDSATATFSVNPRIVLSPNSGSAGLSVSVRGSGFTANAGSCPLTGTPVGGGSTCSQAEDGTVVGQFSVASVPVGPYSVTVSDAAGAPPSASTSFQMTSGPVVVLSPSAGPTGTTVVVTGMGWNLVDTSVTFPNAGLFDGTKTCTVSGGSIASGCSFAVKPNGLGGTYSLTFAGTQGDSAQAQFTLQSSFIINPNNGRPGTTGTFSGSGYTAAVTDCGGDISALPPLFSSTTCAVDSNGILTGTFTVDQTAADGDHAVTIVSPAVQQGSITVTFTVTLIQPPPASFFHPFTEFWFSRYDMKNAQWDAIHIVNVGTGTASIQITCGSETSDSLTLGQGAATYRTYSGRVCGPVHITSDQPIWATQRILGWTAMQEIYGTPGDVASTDIISTWYDLSSAQSDDIWVTNPSTSQTASVDISVAGALKGHLDVAPGQEAVTNFPGVIGGPLRITSSIPVFASQRVIGFGDFAEIIGLPSWYTFTETWFNWYDMKSAQWDGIHMLNPGTTAANVKIYVGGTLQTSLSLAAGAADYRSFPGLVGGPVRIVSDQPIWVTQRIIGWGGWKEVFGVPTTLATTDWHFTWYDMKGASWDAIHIINPGGTDATVQIYVGGILRDTITVPAGQAAHVSYPGLVDGPVEVVSTVPIMSSQRILGWGSFEETIGASLA